MSEEIHTCNVIKHLGGHCQRDRKHYRCIITYDYRGEIGEVSSVGTACDETIAELIKNGFRVEKLKEAQA